MSNKKCSNKKWKQDRSELSATSNESDLPGFYFDPAKNKYFKIQSNYFGVQSTITNSSLKQIKEIENINKRNSQSLKKSQNLINTLSDMQFGNMSKQDHSDITLIYSRLKHYLSIDESKFFSKISILFEDDPYGNSKNYKYFLFNYIKTFSYAPSIYKLDLDQNSLACMNTDNLSFQDFALVDGANSYQIKSCILPAYIQNNTFLVSHYEVNDRVPYKLKISQLAHTSSFVETDVCIKSFSLPMWCSVLSSLKTNMCAVGLPSCAEVSSLADNRKYKLNTNSSDTYAVRFKEDCDNSIFCGKFKYEIMTKVSHYL